MAGTVYLTREGLAQLQAELEKLCNEDRPAIVRAIAEARDKGDLSENAEYSSAKEAQALLEARISKLELTLANARVLDPSSIDTSSVQIHCKVKWHDHTNNRDEEYTIVSPSESDFKNHKLSTAAPLAKALMGHKVGDVVEVHVPKGTLKLEILHIGV